MLTPFGDPHNHDKYSTKKGVILHHIFNSVANYLPFAAFVEVIIGLWNYAPSLFYSKFLSKPLDYAQFYSFYAAPYFL